MFRNLISGPNTSPTSAAWSGINLIRIAATKRKRRSTKRTRRIRKQRGRENSK